MSQEIFALREKREGLQEAVDALYDVLKSHNVTMDTSLTIDGFPRADIDVAQIRSTRHQIICLQNDLKSVQSQLETAVVNYWENGGAGESGTSLNGSVGGTTGGGTTGAASGRMVNGSSAAPIVNTSLAPFATVGAVSAGSPAEQAGLQTNDKIIRLGSVDATTPRIPQALPLAVVEGVSMI